MIGPYESMAMIYKSILCYFSLILSYFFNANHHRMAISSRVISQFRSSDRRIIGSARQMHSTKTELTTKRTFGRCELDSHADTIVAGSNCVILQYTGKECDVSPYRDDYDSISNVPIVHAATAWQSPVTGQTFILVLNEALWMGSMDHSLINPNQLRHFGVSVQDDPTSSRPLSIITEDKDFCMELSMAGTIVYMDTHSPTAKELNECPHIHLSSSNPWNPHTVTFPKSSLSLEDEIGDLRFISALSSCDNDIIEDNLREDDIFNLNSLSRRISGMNVMQSPFNDLPENTDSGSADVPLPNTFSSSERHTDVTPQDLSSKWGISIPTAIKTLKKTTQTFLRSAILPLGRRYRTDRFFSRKTLRGKWSTDTLDGRCKSLEGNRYAQVFANKGYFSKIYPMDRKKQAGQALREFCQEFGIPEHLTFDGSKEQTMKGTEFMKQIRTHGISYQIAEPDLHNQNPVEGSIRELRRKWYRLMIAKRVPREFWDYGMQWVSEISSLTYTTAGSIEGGIPLEIVTGDTPDISEYLDFGFYDQVWYKDNAGSSPPEPGRWLGVSHRVGRLMCYHILNKNGKVISRSTVQRVPNLSMQLPNTQKTFDEFDAGIKAKLKLIDRGYVGDKPNPEDWSDLLDTDDDFREEFERIFNNTDIQEADDHTPDVLDDTYLNMELALPRDGDGPEFAKVTKRLRDANGLPIGVAHENPILDTRLYEVEYLDGHKAALAANAIAVNIFAQVDDEGHRHVLLDSIADHRTNGKQVTVDNAFITSSNGGKRRRETTKGWEILVQWKDGSTSWECMKDVKESYPVQLAEYSVAKQIASQPAFAWWVPHVLRKKKRIVAKVKSKYWTRTHKFGLKLPKTVEEAIAIDRENNNNLWWDAICKEMKEVRIAFEVYEGDVSQLDPAYQKIDCHMIFDIKMGENFRRKARMVAGGHVTTAPASITYSSVVSRDSVRIALTIAALNDLQVLACDIQNAYLTAKCREKVWTIAGKEFGSEAGTPMLITRALYGLKSSGAAFRAHLADHIWDIGYRPSHADADVWMRPAVKSCGFKYYEYILCYVDDVLCISDKPKATLLGIAKDFTLKGDKMEPPDVYLGAGLTKLDNEHGDECWAMSSDSYCAAMITNVEEVLAKKGLRLPSKCVTPMTSGYRPESDCTGELKADGLQWYQEMIGSLRWAIEIGRVDILLEVSLLSKHLALPREGHLEQVLHIMGYLKIHKKLRLLFDPARPLVREKWFKEYDWFDFYRDAKEAMPPNMPEPRGLDVILTCFVDANHAGDQHTRKSQTGVLIFMNKSPIHWYSKQQPTVEASTFGAEFCAMKTAVEMIEGMRYKLRMFGVPIDGPANVYCDNEAVYKNTVIPESTLRKKHHSIAYHRCREAVAAKTIRVAKQGTTKNLADIFTKVMTSARRAFLLERFTY